MPTDDVAFLLIGRDLVSPPQAIVDSDEYQRPVGGEWPSPTYPCWCAQDQLEAVLLEALSAEPEARVLFAHELVSFESNGAVSAVG